MFIITHNIESDYRFLLFISCLLYYDYIFTILRFHMYYQTISYRNILTKNKKFCTRCLKHFKEQKALQPHRWYCKKAVDRENLIDQLKVTGNISKHISNFTIEVGDVI